MFETNHKSLFYRKIMVKSDKSCIRINCRSRPEFLYDMKNVGIYSSINDHNINKDFINVVNIRHWSDNEKHIVLGLGDKNSYFALKQDFSNIVEISNKFDALVESLSKSFEWNQLFLDIGYILNHIKCYERDSSKCIYIYVRSDFRDFDVIEKYDFIVTEKTSPDSNGMVTFNGESLETDKYIVKFISKPKLAKFDVYLDNKIKNLIFKVPCDYYDPKLISYRIPKNKEYDIYFEPKKIEHFIYLKLLNNISWLSNYNNYTEADLLARMYNI